MAVNREPRTLKQISVTASIATSSLPLLSQLCETRLATDIRVNPRWGNSAELRRRGNDTREASIILGIGHRLLLIHLRSH